MPMSVDLERIIGRISPLGFTPLSSRTAGQVLKYDFKGIGPRVVDKSGNFNGGTLKPRWPIDSPRRMPQAEIPPNAVLRFDGENDIIVAPDSTSLDLDREVTIDARVKPLPKAGHQPVLVKNPELEENYELGIRPDEGLASYINTTEGRHMNVIRRKVIEFGEWNRITMTYEPGSYRLYANGSLVNEEKVTGNPIPTDGKLSIGTELGEDRYFKGDMDWVRVYGVAITP